MNHLALTLSVEEPEVTTVSIRPGVVDTDMQREVRTVYASSMVEKDAARFNSLHKEGGLLKPEQPGNVMARLVLSAPNGLSGKFLRYAFRTSGGFPMLIRLLLAGTPRSSQTFKIVHQVIDDHKHHKLSHHSFIFVWKHSPLDCSCASATSIPTLFSAPVIY